MSYTHHEITFTPQPREANTIFARCTCGWSATGPSLEVQGKAACHDLDIEPSPTPIVDALVEGAAKAGMTLDEYQRHVMTCCKIELD